MAIAGDVQKVYYTEVRPGVYKVRWRQWEMRDGRRTQRMKGITVHGVKARDQLIVKIRHALDTVGYYEKETKPEDRTTNLEEAWADWVRWKASRGITAGTTNKHLTTARMFFRAIRQIENIPDDRPIPSLVLTTDLLAQIRLGPWSHLAESSLYGRSVEVYDYWRYLTDDPEKYPGVVPAPRTKSRALPIAPVRGEAPEAPTWEEVSAIARRALTHEKYAPNACKSEIGLRVVTMALTGLRIDQVHAIRVRDFNTHEGTLRIMTGKSRREKADMRKVPVAPQLLELLGERLRVRAADAAQWLFPSPMTGEMRRRGPVARLNQIWQEAVDANEVRLEVWRPPNRVNGRPDHAFRAAFLYKVRGPDSVKDYLVGHASSSTRGRHYAKPTMEDLRAAVESLPRLDLDPAPGAGGATEEADDNVVRLDERRKVAGER